MTPQTTATKLNIEAHILAGSGEITITPGTPATGPQRSKAWSADSWSTEWGEEEE